MNCSTETKSVFASKMNWLGMVLMVCGLLQDPEAVKLLGELIPPQYLSKILSVGGLLVMVLRTCCTMLPISLTGADKKLE